MLALCVAPAGAQQQQQSASAPAGKRLLNFNVRYLIDNIPKNLQLLDFWFPMPQETDAQKVSNKTIRGPYDVETTIDPETGNQYFYMRGGPRGGLGMQVHVTFDVERSQQGPRDLQTPPAAGAIKTDSQPLQRWLRPDTLVVLDGSVKSIASRATSGKRKPVDKARAIYDYVTTNLTLLEGAGALPGAGLGNIKFALEHKKGDAADITAVFIGLCRSDGIPARNVIGWLVPTLIKQGLIERSHHWAEFHLDGYGWIPADPAAGMRTPAKKDWYFGAIDENRIAVSIGRDITLVPAQKERPLNFWATLYWEGDQKTMAIPQTLINFQEVSEIPVHTLGTPAP